MRYFFGGAFLLVGLFISTAAGSMAMTGRNLPGWLGRVRKGSELRLQRAPAAYFRAMGCTSLSFGLFVILVGLVFLTIPQEPSTSYVAILVLLLALLGLAFLASAVWLFVIASRYRLFRWDKP